MTPSAFRHHLKEMVEIASGSMMLEGVEAVQEYCAQLLKGFLPEKELELSWIDPPALSGSKLESSSKQVAKICHIKGPRSSSLRKQKLLLMGHCDTVFGPQSSFTKVEELKDDCWKGPGILDMKVGLLMALSLAITLHREDRDWEWDLVLNGDEEIGSPYSAPYLEQIAPNYDLGLVFEPTFDDGHYAKARYASANGHIRVEGVSAHAGRAATQKENEGQSAIHALGALISELEQLQSPEIFINIGTIEGGEALNVIAPLARAGVNLRLKAALQESEGPCRDPGLLAQFLKEGEKIARSIEKRRPGIKISLDFELSRPARMLDARQQQLHDLLEQAGKELGMAVAWRETGGVCDGNNLSAGGLIVLDSVGGTGSGIHTEEERLDLTSIEPRLILLRKLLDCFKKESFHKRRGDK